VWLGYDTKKSLGNGETGASAALPIWVEFMKSYIEKRGDRKMPPQFDPPGNIAFVTLDSGITEAFINGTQPGGGEESPTPGATPAATPAAAVDLSAPAVAPAAQQ